jgi:hypothetical protein
VSARLSPLHLRLTMRCRPPAALLHVPFEGTPRLIWDVASSDDGERLVDWLTSHSDIDALIEHAFEVTRERDE